MIWRNSYKIPASFIIFFVLIFFLIGEQLPALPIYIGAPHGDSDKVHILDLSPGDALHRPIAYLIIGTIIWGLFRVFAWPIAWVIGAALWALEQLTLTPLDHRPSIPNVIVFTFTVWILLTLVPYFIYKWVDRKWGGRGKLNAILITLGVNLLLFGFFAFQIFVLHNSHRQFTEQGQQGISSDSTPRLPPKTCPERLTEEKDKHTTAYWNGKTLAVAAEEQKWVEQNCPGALKQP